MRMRSLLPALGVGVAVWLGCALYYSRGDTASVRDATAPRDTASAELTRLRDEVDGLRSELARVRRDTALLHARVDALSADHAQPSEPQAEREAAASAADPDDEAATVSTANAVYEAEWSGMVARYASESPDPNWNPAPELGRKLAAEMHAGSRLRELTCRASLCRVQTSHRGLLGYQSFTELFALRADGPQLWSGATSFRVTHEPESPGDTLEAVAYLQR